MKKILATDLDGTLLFPRKFFRFVPIRNKKFLRNYIDNGGRVVLITSRNIKFCDKVIKKIKRPLDCLAQNSAIVRSDGTLLRNEHIDLDLANKIVDTFHIHFQKGGSAIYIANEVNGLIINPKKTRFTSAIGTALWYFSYLWNSESIKISSKLYKNVLENGIINKLVIFNGVSKKARLAGEKIANELREIFPEVEIAWSDYITEITPKGCDKAKGLHFYMEQLDLDKDQIAVVGDSGNDIPMFEEFPLSFAMKHGPEHVKEKAKYVIKRVSDLHDYLDLLEGETHGKQE